MLRLIQIGSGLPVSYPVDISATFQPGQVAQLKVIGNDVVAGVSDGFSPLGIIDDINTSAFTSPSYDEQVFIEGDGNPDGYFLKNTMQNLRFSNIVAGSFEADVEGLILNDINGVIIAPAGIRYNYDSDGDGLLDSLRVQVTYFYRIPNVPGDDTTLGSGRLTVWITRGIFETDMYDPHAVYAINAALFVNEHGFLTTNQTSPNQPRVGMVTGGPSPLINTLEFLWY